MITRVSSRIGGAWPVRTKRIIAAGDPIRGAAAPADDDPGEALRRDRAHDPRAAGDDRRGAHGMAQMGDRFDEVRAAGRRTSRSPASSSSGSPTSTAGRPPTATTSGRLAAAVRALGRPSSGATWTARRRPSRARASRSCSAGSSRQFESFMALDAVAWKRLQAGDTERTKQILLGPELRRFEAMAATADELAAYESDAAAGRQARLRRRPRRRPPAADRGRRSARPS